MINLIDTDQPGRELEHVVPEGNDDELGVLGAFFDVGGDDGDLWFRVSFVKKKKKKDIYRSQ